MNSVAPHEWIPLLWPMSQAHLALSHLVSGCGIAMAAVDIAPPVSSASDEVQRWVDDSARALGVEAEPTELRYDRLHISLARRSPLFLKIEIDGGPWFVCVLSVGRYRARLLVPGEQTRHVRVAGLLQLLRATLESPTRMEGIERLAAHAGISARQQQRLRTTYLRQAVGNLVAVEGWAIRPAPGSAFWQQLRRAGLPMTAAGFLALQTAEYIVWVLAWWLLGRALFSGYIDRWLLIGWSMLLGTLVLVRARSQRLQATLAIGIGALLKRRLLDGVLRLSPDETRGHGVGQLLGRTMESESIEVLALAGGFFSLAAVLQLVVAGAIIAGAAGSGFVLSGLLVWFSISVAVAWMLARLRGLWVDTRLALTHDLVESMVGFRTRLAQEAPSRWHRGEDVALDSYVEQSRAMDRITAILLVLPRTWSLCGMMMILLTTGAAGSGSDITLAVGIGALLLSYGALRQLTVGFTSVIDAALAWKRVRVLFHASSRTAAPSLMRSDQREEDRTTESTDEPLIEARGLSYRFEPSRDPVLTNCEVVIRRGDRLLLEGPSGAGKSTLASLLAGMRRADAGTLSGGGQDFAALGEHAWRRRVVVAPQFHENHVLADTFLFNVLMGRRWPPNSKDIKAALEVCRELGLGPLIDRMPGGVHQFVGDTGWQLSHGERSRLFVARALLQEADVVIFDESFAALDPETLRECLACVMKRAPAALLIAHP